ncbi:MAG: hypothetical protein LQ338_005558 [Usnochroma carphineum]|nr:MAG: hypothetical protein LQ338_005558 [Usnochroma carphineum]
MASDMELSVADLRAALAEAQQQVAETQQQVANTTLLAYVEKYHERFGDGPDIPKDKSKCTTGRTSTVTRKIRPAHIKRWEGFLDLRREKFLRIQDFLNDQPLFPSLHGIDQIANQPRNVVSSEVDLRVWHSNPLETPVKLIAAQLIALPNSRTEFSLGKRMNFENHVNTLSEAQSDRRPKDADQICVKVLDDDNESTVAVVEFKAPHKATKELLTAGLQPLDIKRDVLDREGGNETGAAKFQRSAEKFVAMIITQTYSYMVRGGVRYGCIITGQATVFLLIPEDDPLTVYFYHADPFEEVQDELSNNSSFPHECTAIAQMISFCVMAHDNPGSSQAWRSTVRDKNLRWDFDDFESDHRIPIEAATLTKPPSAFKPRRTITSLYRTPIKTRSKCKPNDDVTKYGPESDSDSDEEFDHDETPTKPPPRRQEKQVQQPQGEFGQGKQVSRKTARDYAYCTQECMRGLSNRTAMDPYCPNYPLHPRRQLDSTHALTRPLLARLLRQQLATDLDDYCIDLQKQGCTGRLFKLVLASHGYTFVGKGTIKLYIPDLKIEGRVYNRLKDRQGRSIPVHLGNIDLLRPWMACTFDIVHMLLMSYAGECVWNNIAQNKEGDEAVYRKGLVFDEECVKDGVLNRDTFQRNMMWNDETNQIMFIDFDRSILFDLARPPKGVTHNSIYIGVFGHWKRRKAQEKRMGAVEEAEGQAATVVRHTEQDRSHQNQLAPPTTEAKAVFGVQPEESRFVQIALPEVPPSRSRRTENRAKVDWVIHTDTDTKRDDQIEGEAVRSPSTLASPSTTHESKAEGIPRKAGDLSKSVLGEEDKENAPVVDPSSQMFS